MTEPYSHSDRRWEFGPKVVAIGGGTGLSTMLRGLKAYTKNLTAIVTVADDGGGSGVLRQDLGMPPPGDIRHCMQALANVEPVMEQLLAYRFPAGSGALTGQAFGNLLLAALNGIADSFDGAVASMSEVLAITGRVLPVTNADVALEATFENGTTVLGESKICDFKKSQDCRIRSMRLIPAQSAPLPEALCAIAEADLILLGPGSLYTSVIPNLLVPGISEAIRAASGLKMYICNIMTQDGETEGMTAADHVAALLAHSGPGIVELCLCNSSPVRPGLLERYQEEDAVPITVDKAALKALGVEPICRPLASQTSDYARHSTAKLAAAVMEIYADRAKTKVF
ncbi:MAG: YvcK family protein [Pseudoflavonifractor sp.]